MKTILTIPLDLQHELCKMSLHGRLHLAPLREESLTHALDFGTGTGIWAMEFGESLSITSRHYLLANHQQHKNTLSAKW